MAPDYVDITFPNGSVLRCATPKRAITQMAKAHGGTSDPVDGQGAEIWWGLIPDFSFTPLHDTFSLWLPWISVLHLYTDPLNLLHCTFNYELYGDENYDALWDGFLQQCLETGKCPIVEIRDIYLGSEGVAAAVSLPDGLKVLYALGDTAAPAAR